MAAKMFAETLADTKYPTRLSPEIRSYALLCKYNVLSKYYKY